MAVKLDDQVAGDQAAVPEPETPQSRESIEQEAAIVSGTDPSPDFSISPPAESLTMSEETKSTVRYLFPENQTISYLLECSGRKGKQKEQLNGLITLDRSVGDPDATAVSLKVRCRIERNRSEQNSSSTASGPSVSSTATSSFTTSDDRVLSLNITPAGAIIKRDGESQLPLGIGDAAALVIHDFTHIDTENHQHKRVVMHDSSLQPQPESAAQTDQSGVLSVHPDAPVPRWFGPYSRSAKFHDLRPHIVPVFQFDHSSVQNSLELDVRTQQQQSTDSLVIVSEKFISPPTGDVRVTGTSVRKFNIKSGVMDFIEIHQSIVEGTDESGAPNASWNVELTCRRISGEEKEQWEEKRKHPENNATSDVEAENPFKIVD